MAATNAAFNYQYAGPIQSSITSTIAAIDDVKEWWNNNNGWEYCRLEGYPLLNIEKTKFYAVLTNFAADQSSWWARVPFTEYT
uniref:Uncharacterized protein n=1 Tax=Ditylenchus dipsaci TaxID=166011 RepID=A0A915EFP6_9BILA